ncbi:MAG TPA: phosphorylated adapter RNA export RNA-binding domain-containing protein [Ktedonobacteraceae bacterium]|nr:phosphorylated adapter RNA export RNA-binding domain-containing protein [Ktedonobacteraceae bacterium]
MSEQQPETSTTHSQEPAEVTMTIAEQLGETEAAPVSQIRRAVKALGTEQALALLKETLSIQAQGGLMLPDASRRRTAGGVFFHLIRTTVPKQVRTRIFLPPPPKPAVATAPGATVPEAKAAAPAAAVLSPLRWQDRIAVLDEINTQKGMLTTVKITLVGRPGKIMDRGTCIMTKMASSSVPSLPKGLPAVPATSTNYVVYIASKQWKKVAEAITDPDDMLILEGFPLLDSETNSIAVFVSNATTKNLQRAQKQAKAPTPGELTT